MKVINKKQYMESVMKAADQAADIIGKTMTVEGLYVDLQSGVTTNDGVTIINSIDFEDVVEQSIIKKIRQAAVQTDKNGGDGTSATTIMTRELLSKLPHDNSIPVREIEKQLKEFKDVVIKYINDNKHELKDEKDYINLAKISTKDDQLGELIGKAFYDGGTNPMIMIRNQTNGNEDEVEVEAGYVLPVTMAGLGLPEVLENPLTIIVRGPMNRESDALKKLATIAVDKKKEMLIIASEIGEITIRFINSFNQMNGTKISLLTIPNGNQLISQKEIIEDLTSVVGGTPVHLDAIAQTTGDIDFGTIKAVAMKPDGTYFLGEKENKLMEARVKVLAEEMKKLDASSNKHKANVIRSRINMLEGKTVYFNIYAATTEEWATKKLRIEDAIKATQMTLGFGYVYGSGTVFSDALKENAEALKDNIFADALRSIEKTIHEIAGIEVSAKDKYYDTGKGLDVTTGKVTSLKDAGIIDSARVAVNIIENSVSIVKNISKIHYKLVNDEG